ncbi:acyl-CoA dehydrogenase family protein [Dactylosporangium sp. NPDC051484]|uniref:acyl-CoA dehydrogenase family protein n=1 Tax=Dactylosporangium sp. NPDC051484 TaxID=3154942 RepID=UPI00344E4BDC
MTKTDADVIAETIAQIVDGVRSDRAAPELDGGFDAELWLVLASSGMTAVGVDDALGGSGGLAQDAVAVVRALARAAAHAPVAEHAMAASWLLESVRREMPSQERPLAIVTGPDLRFDPTTRLLSGSADSVPWADAASGLVVVARAEHGSWVCLIEAAAAEIVPGTNLAGESRCAVVLDVAVEAGDAAPLDAGQPEEVQARLALIRATQIAAVVDETLRRTLRYCDERAQFGRTLNNFQSTRDALAELAGEAAVVSALADRALGDLTTDRERFPVTVAAAKIRASLAARRTARLAHQLHGAIGFTREHPLRLLTTRLWAWSNEAGNEREWSQWLGRHLVSQERLWTTLVGGRVFAPDR